MSSSSCRIGKFCIVSFLADCLCSLLSQIFPLSHCEDTGANPFISHEYDDIVY